MKTAKPLFLFVAVCFCFQTKTVHAQGWSNLGLGMGNLGVISMATYNGDLYAAGSFTLVEGNIVRRIAKWNGAAWDSLGSGTGGSITAITSYNGELYAGGQFTTAGGLPANKIARWDGISWDSLESGTDDAISALKIYNGELYVGGNFDFAGGMPSRCIAKWDGNSWFSLPNIGNINVPLEIAVYNGSLYVGTGVSGYVKIWNGSVWDSIPSPVIGGITGMAVYNGELYVCGPGLIYVGNNPQIPVNMIAKWNGTEWSDVGGGLTICCNQPRQAWTMIVYNGELYAGGKFEFAGGVPASNIAKWNGTTWSPVCGGVNSTVRTFSILSGELYVGGFFTAAGGIPANRVAKYSPAAATITPSAATVCNNNSVILSANSGSYAYQWYNNNILMPGETNQQLSVSTPGSYSVVTYVINQQCADTTTSLPVQVTEGTGPADVTITSTSSVGCEPNTIYTGYGAQSITLTANAATAVSYLWSTGETAQSISVSAAGSYSVTAFDAGGCASVQTPESEVNINVIDARCGNNNSKITLCHVPHGNASNAQTICIASSAVAAHLALHEGDCIGECMANNRSAGRAGEEGNFVIHPNPASGLFNIFFSNPDGEADVTIVNYIGQVVYKSGEFSTSSVPYEINFVNQPDGIYTIQVKYKDRVFTSRLVLNK